MSRLVPAAFAAPLRVAAAYAQDTGGSPAVLAEVREGALSVYLATGLADTATGAAARITQTFEVGSQTKPMTAAILLKLQTEGLVDLDRPVSDYLSPEQTAGIVNTDTATLRQLLAMRSGIPDFVSVLGDSGQPRFIEALLTEPDEVWTTEDSLDLVRGLPANAVPGTAYDYSNVNYLLLGKVIEAVTGQDLVAVFKARVFDPLGMGDSTLDGLAFADDRLHSYATDTGGTVLDVTRAPLQFGAEGGVVSTTADMIRFFEALLVSRTFLTPAELAQMMTFEDLPAPDVPGAISSRFGLGLAGVTLGGQEFAGFTGGTLGTISSTYVNLGTGAVASAVVTNGESNSDQVVFRSLLELGADPVWTGFDPAVAISMAGSAADLVLRNERTAAGERITVLDLDGTAIRINGGIGSFDAESLTFDDGSRLVIGRAKADSVDLNGTAGASGRNLMLGRGGDDCLAGGAQADVLRGGAGDDTLDGRGGNDRLLGGAGDDVFLGGQGDDLIFGGAGMDRLRLDHALVDVTTIGARSFLDLGLDGLLTLHGVEVIMFGDATLWL